MTTKKKKKEKLYLTIYNFDSLSSLFSTDKTEMYLNHENKKIMIGTR